MKPRNTPLTTALTAAASTGGSPTRLLPLVPAAASALFALQHQADAAIIYSGPNQNVTASFVGNTGTATKSLAIGEIDVWRFDRTNNRHAAAFFGVGGPSSASTRVFHNGSGGLKRLAAGALISVGKLVNSSRGYLRQFKSGVGTFGTWAKGQTGFGGFQLPNGDLGWVRLEWTSNDSNPTPDSITAIDWAYDTTPGEAIQAGQTVAAPEPSAAALLALAAGGAAFLRRKRASAGKS